MPTPARIALITGASGGIGSAIARRFAAEGFRLMQTQALRTTITLSSNEDVQALFLMTPYYYKTGAEDQKKLAAVQSLRVTTEFLLAVYQPA